MTTPSVPAPAEQYRQCPTCGFATPATRTRCHNCWVALDNAPVLEPDRAAELLERQTEYEARREADAARRVRRRRLLIGAVLLLLLAWVGWWTYRTFIYEPPPVPAPSSTERQLLTGPEVWATSGGDLSNSRRTEASVPLEADVAWSASLGGTPSTPVVADGERLYSILGEDRLVALSLEDGSVAWEFELQGSPLAAPTLAGDRLYMALRAGQLVALDAATGREIFSSLNTRVRFGTSPVVADGVAYAFGIGDLVAFDAENGDVLWQTGFEAGRAFVNPVVTEGYIAGTTGDRALMFSRANGTETYFYEFPRSSPYSTVAVDGSVFVASSRFAAGFEDASRRPWWEGTRAVWSQFWLWGMAPDVPAPPALWQANNPPEDGFPGALTGDSLILAGASGDLVAMRLADGTDAWRVDVDEIVAAPLVTPDGVLVAHPDRLALYDPASGEVLAERPLEGAAPSDVVVTSRGLFVVGQDGTVTAIR